MADGFVTLVAIQPSSGVQLERGGEDTTSKHSLFQRLREPIRSPGAPGTNPLLSPRTLYASSGTLSNLLTWAPVAGGSSYSIYWATTPGVTKSSNKISGATSAYVHSSLNAGQPYYYALAVVSEYGEGPLGVEVSATPVAVSQNILAPITAPIIYPLTVYLGTTIYVSWSPLDSRAVSSNLYWSLTPGVTKSSNKISGASAPYTHLDRSYLTTYYYAVSSVSSSGAESELSNEVSITTQASDPFYLIPQNGLITAFDASALLTTSSWTDRVGGLVVPGLSAANSATYGGVSVFRSSGTASHPIGGSFNFTTPFTMLVVDRYNGLGANARGRNISGVGNNWLLGKWTGKYPSFYAGAWVGPQANSPNSNDNWHITIGLGGSAGTTTYKLYADGVDVTGGYPTGQGGPGTSLAFGGAWNEYSNSDTALMIYWNRILSPAECDAVFQAYRSRFGI